MDQQLVLLNHLMYLRLVLCFGYGISFVFYELNFYILV